jgi:prefoldin subunit 5
MKKTELKAALTNLNKIKSLVVSLGMPYSNVRNLDDAIRTIERIITRLEKEASK